MYVQELALEDFRNYEREKIRLAPGINLVLGKNAQGKTNLLEAVHYLSGLGSPRSPDAVVVRGGAERALLHAVLRARNREMRVDMEIRAGRGTRLLIDKTSVSRPAALGRLPVCVHFGPDEPMLVKGPPEGRRRFIDDLVVKLRPARDALRRDVDRVVRQRNALLKEARREGRRPDEEVMTTWDGALVRAGAALATARLETLAALAPFSSKRYEEVAGGGRMDLSYESSYLAEDAAKEALTDPAGIDRSAIESSLAERLEELRIAEFERGGTLVGPQRDDIVVRLMSPGGNDPGLVEARTFASQGDQRTCALALKLGEQDLLVDALEESPILLLDDVFSELDPDRRRWLADAIRHGGQVLVTSADPTAELEAIPEAVIRVDSGGVVDG